MKRRLPTRSQKTLGIGKAKINFRKHERTAMNRHERRTTKRSEKNYGNQ